MQSTIRAARAALRGGHGNRDRGPARAGTARARRRALEHDLASYTSQNDRNDLDAILSRYSDEETAEIRAILGSRRS